ncbi:MAG: tetratricopeptide repeat protein [Dehalococcoidales bacterium]
MEDLTGLENRALDAFYEGDYKKARDIYYKLIKISPANPRFYTHLAECYQRLGDLRLAENCRARAEALSSHVETTSQFCGNCGSKVEHYHHFCGNCGANMGTASPPPTGQPAPMPRDTAKQEQPASIAQASSAREESRTKPARTPRSNRNTIFYAITALLVVALIALGIFYEQEVSKLNEADTRITGLTANVTSLEGQLTTEKANVATLQTQLTAANGQVTSLTADLATANGKVTSLTADLATANGKVTSLTSDLATANAKVTSTQASLDKANSDLAAALITNTTQAATLKTVQDPRHFDTLAELTAWLAKDDTNTNPAYASYSGYSKAFILQVKALRDGYILPACLDWDSSYIYSWNVAVVGGIVYSIDPTTDVLTQGPTFGSPPPSHPLPLP